ATLENVRAELARERDRYQATLGGLGDAVIATDANGAATLMNPEAEQLTGWKAAEALNVPLAKVFHIVNEQTRSPLDSPVARAIKSGRAQTLSDSALLVARGGRETQVAGGAVPMLDDGGNVTGVVLSFRDVGDLRRARATLEESERRFRTMADNAPALMWMANSAGERVFFNRTWLDFTGRTLEEERGDGWTTDLHPEDYTHCLDVVNAAIEERKRFALEYRLRRHDGEFRWVYDEGVPHEDGNGQFAGFIGVAVDQTDRKGEDTEHGSVDRGRSEFIAMLAHELRNPLAPIRNAVQIIARLTTGRDPRLDHACEVVDRQSALLTNLIDDLLDVARIETGKILLKRETLSVQDVVRQAVETSQPAVRDRGHTLEVSLPPEPVYVDGDRTRLVQALRNLISNAAKFTADGGRIEIAAQVEDDAVEISVTDNGEGIEPTLLPVVFDLFHDEAQAARQPRRGLGLGLTIVRRLVGLHGGSVSATSEGHGKGARFSIRLPLAAGAPEARHEASEPARTRVLVVDDNVDAAVAIATLLEIGGYSVSAVHDPRTAMARATETPFDVIVLDIGLPEMSGYELAVKLRTAPINSRAKLVALTGYGQAGDEGPAKAAGFAGYLVKPVDADQLLALVADLTRRDRSRRRA
ncbi:MAG TPA: PAS domain S-box protein, partial [Casimicrobiaceae bacterium]|nr:PAS domain S-box protein [Casimicrobiaceae bacterium]